MYKKKVYKQYRQFFKEKYTKTLLNKQGQDETYECFSIYFILFLILCLNLMSPHTPSVIPDVLMQAP